MRLLLAEDEKSLSKALAVVLQKNNYSVDTTYDGEETERFLKTGEYDAVIMDIMMPKKDGLTVLRQMRKDGDMTPVIMLTAKSLTEDKVEGLDSGANDYLTKPFETAELLARIRVLTRTNSTQKDKFLKFGNVTLDQTTCEMSGPSGSVKLSGKEYQLMEYLLNNPRMIMSAERFMDKIWGMDSDADISVVWTFLSYLRKKLANIGADISIKTSRGQGYYLEENDR